MSPVHALVPTPALLKRMIGMLGRRDTSVTVRRANLTHAPRKHQRCRRS